MRDQRILGEIFQALQENDPRETADATICYEIYDRIERFLMPKGKKKGCK